MRFSNVMTKAEQGRAFWLSNDLDKYDYVLLLPHEDIELNTKLRSFADSHNIPILSGHVADAIITLYCMYEFTDKLIIGSFELPFGRKLSNLLSYGATEEELINDVILGGFHGA